MKRILIISLIFTLLLSGCGYTEDEREKEILVYMVEAIDAEKEYMENDFSLKYSVQITDALKGLTELMLDIEVEDRD